LIVNQIESLEQNCYSFLNVYFHRCSIHTKVIYLCKDGYSATTTVLSCTYWIIYCGFNVKISSGRFSFIVHCDALLLCSQTLLLLQLLYILP